MIQKLIDVGIGILYTLFFISFAVVIILNFRPLYYMDISLLSIEEESGFSEQTIKENYDALIDYNSPFYKGELEFPTLPSSQQGLQHFKEVKVIFNAFYYMIPITLLCLIPLSILRYRKKGAAFLRTAAATVTLLPVLAGIFLAVNFDRAFVLFHKLFFRNDYWLFDYRTDPVILILPDTFFLHCAAGIVLLVLAGSLLLLTAYHFLKKKGSIQQTC